MRLDHYIECPANVTAISARFREIYSRRVCRKTLIARSFPTSSSILHTPHFPDQCHLNLPGVRHLRLDLLSDIPGDLHADLIVNLVGIDNYPNFAAGLDRIRLTDAIEGLRQCFPSLAGA